MTVVICSNMLSGSTGLDKSTVMTANHLRRDGYHVQILNFVGAFDGSEHLSPKWPLDTGVPVFPLQTLPASGGRYLPDNFLAADLGSDPEPFVPTH